MKVIRIQVIAIWCVSVLMTASDCGGCDCGDCGDRDSLTLCICPFYVDFNHHMLNTVFHLVKINL